MSDPNLLTSCNFHGLEFLLKMNVIHNCLEIVITDKNSGEEWQCSYDATYIENLTHKTGNFKQFDIFVTMLKTGLLKTSECVSLDLLTYEDLEMLRIRRMKSQLSTRSSVFDGNNRRRYLILTYSVEFDKIHYPLPLEYCGPPDPAIMQATIRRLQSELENVKEQSGNKTSNETKKVLHLQKRIDGLTDENFNLKDEIRRLNRLVNKSPNNQVKVLQKAILSLEKSVMLERNSHHQLVDKLKHDKTELIKELERVKSSERSLKVRLNGQTCEGSINKSDQSLKTMYRKKPSKCQKTKTKSVNAYSNKSSTRKCDNLDLPLLNRLNNKCNKKIGSHGSSVSSGSRSENTLRSYNSSRKNRSCNSSIVSRGSSTISERKTKKISLTSIKLQAKQRDSDFTALQEKITSLQKMLQNNMNLL